MEFRDKDILHAYCKVDKVIRKPYDWMEGLTPTCWLEVGQFHQWAALTNLDNGIKGMVKVPDSFGWVVNWANKLEISRFSVGDRVRHISYGIGTVLGNQHTRYDGKTYWHIGYDNNTFGYAQEASLTRVIECGGTK